MNIGIAFSLESINIVGEVATGDSERIERIVSSDVKNFITVSKGRIYVGDDALLRAEVDPEAKCHSLAQIHSLNGIVLDRKRYSVEEIVHLLMARALEKLAERVTALGVDYGQPTVVIACLPPDNIYFWRQLLVRWLGTFGAGSCRVVEQTVAASLHPKLLDVEG